jgi:hypothetical protein
VDPLTCSLSVLVTAALGVSGDARPLPVTVQDDAMMLHRSAPAVRATAHHLARLGADRVRLTASWSTLAPKPRRKRAPDFDAADPDAYPRESWIHLDRAVKATVAAGLEPQIDVAFFAPRWAVKRKTKTETGREPRERWIPDPKAFGRFAAALASRYSGSHRDPAQADERLPAVRTWTTWNEPNHPAFLLPQWRRRGGRWVPQSPDTYRPMHMRAYRAIKRVSSKNDVLISGSAAARGGKRGPMGAVPPLRFLRELACVDRRGRPLRRGRCAKYRPIAADGYAHHPYSFRTRPDVPSRHRDNVQMADMGRLSRLIGELDRRGRINAPWPIYVTEYGYETNPPDIRRGVTLRRQARWHGLATYMAWRQPEVAQFAQFLLYDISPPLGGRDDPEVASESWQTGLYFFDGRPKQPALQAFKLPFWAESHRFESGYEGVVFFGEVRPEPGRQQVEVERRGSDGTWRPIQTYETREAGDVWCDSRSTTFFTDVEGVFFRLAPHVGAGQYRMRWIKPNGRVVYGVSIRVGAPRATGS